MGPSPEGSMGSRHELWTGGAVATHTQPLAFLRISLTRRNLYFQDTVGWEGLWCGLWMLDILSFDPFGLKICIAVFLHCASRGEVAFHTSVVSPSFADEEEALNSIMKDLAALGKCGGLLDNNRNKNSVHSSKQVRHCSSPPQTPVNQRGGRDAHHAGRTGFKCWNWS